MAPRSTVAAAIAVGAATCLAIAGCGDGDAPAAAGPASPASYVIAVEGLVGPPAQLATAIAERGADPDSRPSERDRLTRLMETARRRLAELRAMRFENAGLRRSRDRLASAYTLLMPRMQAVAEALAGRDGAALDSAAGPFLDSLRTLPSGASPSSR